VKLPAPFGKYHLLERIAVGGMAELFLAKSFGAAGFERLLVIKKILPHMAEDREFITMFIDEARIASTLNHSNIVQINELGKEDNDYYIAMEFVHGKDLSRIYDRLQRQSQRLSIPLAVYVTSRVCEGLDYAHRKADSTGKNLHIIHRDVSPGNVLISYDGDVKLIDFGIAKAQNRLGHTTAGTLKGKFGYMSPEQVRGLPLDHRSDIFSVGILLFEMLTGKRLFGSESDFGTLEKVRNAIVTPPTTYNSDIPAELEKIILRALAREPDDRFQHACDLQDALSPFLLEEGSLATGKSLASFMRLFFAEEIATENDRLAVYRRRGYPWMEGGNGQEPAGAEEKANQQPGDGATFVFDSTQDDYTPPPEPEMPDALVAVSEELATVVMPGGLEQAPEQEQKQPPAREGNRSPPARKTTSGLNRRRGGTPPAGRPLAVRPRVRRRLPRSGTEPLRGRNLNELRRSRQQSSRGTWLSFLAGLSVAGALAALYLVFLAPKGNRPEQEPVTVATAAPADRPVAAVASPAPAPPPAPVAKPPAASAPPATSPPAAPQSPGEKPPANPATPPRQPPATAADAVAPPRPVPPPGPDETPAAAKKSPPESKPARPRPAAPAPPPPAGKPALAGSSGRDSKKAAPERRQAVVAATSTSRTRPPAKRTRQGFSLLVTSKPPGAEILLNGKPSGKTPSSFSGLDPGRNYFLVLKKPGYKPFFHGVKPGRRQQVKVAAVMQPGSRAPAPATRSSPGTGYLVANTRPWARVIVDGKDTGLWTPVPPAKKLALPAGRHTVVFRTKEGKELKVTVTIEAGKTHKVIRKIP